MRDEPCGICNKRAYCNRCNIPAKKYDKSSRSEPVSPQPGPSTSHANLPKKTSCKMCKLIFPSRILYLKHLRKHKKSVWGPNKRYKCDFCGFGFNKKSSLENHINITHLTKHCGFQSALKGSVRIWKYANRGSVLETHNFLKRYEKEIKFNICAMLKKYCGLKWYVCLQAEFSKQTMGEKECEAIACFRSKTWTLTHMNEYHSQFIESIGQIHERMGEYQREGSNWILKRVHFIELRVAKYEPLYGSSFIPTPSKITGAMSVLNIQNKDAKCFIWSVLSSKFHIDRKSHPYRVYHYQPHEGTLNVTGLEFPMKIKQISQFEKLNDISVNVFGWCNKTAKAFPLRISKLTGVHHVDLLYIKSGNKGHYCLIRDLSRFLAHLTKHQGKSFYCPYCLHRYSSEQLLSNHRTLCGTHKPQVVECPKVGKHYLEFKKLDSLIKLPYIVYSDFESVVEKTHHDDANTTRLNVHKPSGFAFLVLDDKGAIHGEPCVHSGEDTLEVFWREIIKVESELKGILKKQNPNSRKPPFIPVVFHNLKGFDSHLILQGMSHSGTSDISVIPINAEKYVSFSVGSLRFIDSLQFLNASLDTLVSNLAKEGKSKFSVLNALFPSDKVDLLLAKGVYPYEYMDSFSRLDETSLPPKEAFYSSLTDSHISTEQYARAQEVWKQFGARNMADFQNTYVLADCAQLACVYESFRTMCLSYYEIDPAHYYTSPGLSFQACLKMTQVRLELLTDIDMHLFIEKGIRGGISSISTRHCLSNNKYMTDFDSTKPSTFIAYWDMNNLYGYAMTQPLPVGEFTWMGDEQILKFDVTAIPDDSDYGYIVEADLDYPDHLHDLHSDYPLLPEHMTVTEDMISPYTKTQLKKLGKRMSTTKKLIPHLGSRTNYVIHYRNLKQCIDLGIVVKKIHRILTFRQIAWMKDYIDFNSQKRQLATNDFEKDFFKLMNNAVFGKTMENLRNRCDIKLVRSEQQAIKLIARPTFIGYRIFNENLVGVEMLRSKITFNRPIYTGFCILELSKLFMYNFHYNFIKAKLGEKARLLFTDTDSLAYSIECDCVYQIMADHSDLFDLSNYPQSHPLFSNANKRVVGKMKDEFPGRIIHEFVGLRPKLYSIKEYTGQVTKKGKGVTKCVLKNKITHADYLKCLQDGLPRVDTMHSIRSYSHNLYTQKQNKVSLSSDDNKRYILDDGVNTLAYFHYKLKTD